MHGFSLICKLLLFMWPRLRAKCSVENWLWNFFSPRFFLSPAKHSRIKVNFFFAYGMRSKNLCNLVKLIEHLKSFVSFHFVFLQLITWLTVSCDFVSARECAIVRRDFFCPTICRCILSQRRLLFGLLVIQLRCYILKQLFASVSVKVVDIYLHLGQNDLSVYSVIFQPLFWPNALVVLIFCFLERMSVLLHLYWSAHQVIKFDSQFVFWVYSTAESGFIKDFQILL